MEAIVLAGGMGTRLRAVLPELPKPMAPVGGRPFLELLLARMARQGFDHVVLSLGYKAEIIARHFGAQFRSLKLSYEIEQQPLGTGGAVRTALEHCRQDHVYIFNGDTFIDLDVAAVEALWQAHREPIIVARQLEDVSRFGRMETEDGRITGFTEKGAPGPGLINAGCYVMGRHVLDEFDRGAAFSLERDYFYNAVHRQPFRAFVSDGLFIDIGVPEDYARAQIELPGFLD